MLLVGELIITLLGGFVLGRVWEIRQRIMLAEPVDQVRRPIEIRVANKHSEPSAGNDSKLLALEREMKDLIKAVAVPGRRPNSRAIEPRA